MFWSALTLLTAVTHTYWELLVRHTLVGIGEATFVTIAPTFVADLFPEKCAAGYSGFFIWRFRWVRPPDICWEGNSALHYGWRFPFYIAAFPGFLLALAVLFLPGAAARPIRFFERNSRARNNSGTGSNPAFWTVTLGMAAGTFSLGGIQVWMPTFLSRARGYSSRRRTNVRCHRGSAMESWRRWREDGWETACCRE